MSSHRRSPSCFRGPSVAAADAATATTAMPNLTTSLYNTEAGLFALSWSRSRFGRSLHLQHHSLSAVHLHIKTFPWPYAGRKGSKKLYLADTRRTATVFWDLSGAKYGSRPEPISGFYVAVAVSGEIALLVGDLFEQACARAGETDKRDVRSPMILRREHVYGTKLYSTAANIGGRERNISIECQTVDDPRLHFNIDGKSVLEIKHLKWKFRGNETVEIDGDSVQISWDVYNWLFAARRHRHHDGDRQEDGYALFVFAIMPQRTSGLLKEENHYSNINGLMPLWPNQFNHHEHSFGLGFEGKKMKKKKGFLSRRSGRLSSCSSSLSSANSSGSCSSSVMEWADRDEDEFTSLPYSHGFSLLVYAWKN